MNNTMLVVLLVSIGMGIIIPFVLRLRTYLQMHETVNEKLARMHREGGYRVNEYRAVAGLSLLTHDEGGDYIEPPIPDDLSYGAAIR